MNFLKNTIIQDGFSPVTEPCPCVQARLPHTGLLHSPSSCDSDWGLQVAGPSFREGGDGSPSWRNLLQCLVAAGGPSAPHAAPHEGTSSPTRGPLVHLCTGCGRNKVRPFHDVVRHKQSGSQWLQVPGGARSCESHLQLRRLSFLILSQISSSQPGDVSNNSVGQEEKNFSFLSQSGLGNTQFEWS